ncbi:MAG: hypothetical protein H7282_16705 [Cytophagaceae bacterium]|nr:hypothetical protein [Cytophagaceae bacterium]
MTFTNYNARTDVLCQKGTNKYWRQRTLFISNKKTNPMQYCEGHEMRMTLITYSVFSIHKN